MIATLLASFLIAVDFVPQEMPGLQVGPVKGQTGAHSVNFRHADLDHDGNADLVFADSVWLQRDGMFPSAQHIPLPTSRDARWIDVWSGQVYCWEAAGLTILKRDAGNWVTVHEQSLARPTGDDDFTPDTRTLSGSGPAKLHRFLAAPPDGVTPDLVALSESGLHRFSWTDDAYVATGDWNIFPPMRLAVTRTQAVWPPEDRRFVFPAEQMDCRVVVEGSALRVVTRHAAPEQQSRYETRPFTLTGTDMTALPVVTTPPVPRHVRPTRLNNDAVPDFAGTRWDLSESSVWPVPVCETWASLDGGATFTIRRAPSLQRARPAASFLDFDADGDMELVTESTALFSAGTREALNQMLSRSAVDHVVRVYRQTDGGFEQKPWITASKTIALDAPPLRGGARLDQYSAAKLVDLTGDFNGDNRKDLLISQEPGKLSLYLLEGAGYPARAHATRNYDEARSFSAADINGDGRSDLVFRSNVPNVAPVVWFTTGERP